MEVATEGTAAVAVEVVILIIIITITCDDGHRVRSWPG